MLRKSPRSFPSFVLLILCSLLIGCSHKKSAPPEGSQKAPLFVPPVAFEVGQRQTLPVPESENGLLITLGDITGGQVLVSVSGVGGETYLPRRFMRSGSSAEITLSDQQVMLNLLSLKNALVGDDVATFQMDGRADRPGISEEAKIEALIAALEGLDDVVFLRNGKEHTVEEAVEHMRGKWKWKRKEIKTVEDFIRIAGTESSTSGKVYLIRFPDGQEMESAVWFRAKLEEILKAD